MDMPEMLPDETFGDYRKRNNLPHVYVPFFPYNEQVDWQVELQKKFPTISIYPYDGMQVSKGAEVLFILFEHEDHITEQARESIIRHCCDYGRERAESVVPGIKQLRQMYEFAKQYV